ncbi:MAG: hypothetical protein AABN95_04550 [Acidobacteriota bacterium]
MTSQPILQIVFCLVQASDPQTPWFDNPLVPIVALSVALASLFLAAVTFFKAHLWPHINAFFDRRSFKKSVAALSLSDEEIERAQTLYIEPFVQNVDPMGSEEPRAHAGVKNKLFETLDSLFHATSPYRYLILLADSGMGKTSALINYNIRHLRRRYQKFQVALIFLSKKSALQEIQKITERRDCILFLDAFDEDTLAIKDHQQRLDELMVATDGFRRVVVTCRTQFFRIDEEIPREVATLRVVAPRAAAQPAAYTFHKLYLSPFSEDQTKVYISKSYPINVFARRRAQKLADKIPHLATRPLLLSHIHTLVRQPEISYAFEAYDVMVKAWLEREKGFIQEEDQLERFSELLAVDLYLNRESRDGERVPREQLVGLAKEWGIPIIDRQVSDYKFSTRSLLNRDADGNCKFAHRSIMEYLFVKQYLTASSSNADEMRRIEWTDQMRTFYWEMIEKNVLDRHCVPYDKRNYNGDYILDENEIPFVRAITLHGLSLLSIPQLARQRFGAVMTTTTAMCARLVDPKGRGDPVVSLIGLASNPDKPQGLKPIAIHYHGKLLSISPASLVRYMEMAERSMQWGGIPDIGTQAYVSLLPSLERLSGGWHSCTLPLQFNGETVGIFAVETSRVGALEKDWEHGVIEILTQVAGHLWENRNSSGV